MQVTSFYRPENPRIFAKVPGSSRLFCSCTARAILILALLALFGFLPGSLISAQAEEPVAFQASNLEVSILPRLGYFQLDITSSEYAGSAEQIEGFSISQNDEGSALYVEIDGVEVDAAKNYRIQEHDEFKAVSLAPGRVAGEDAGNSDTKASTLIVTFHSPHILQFAADPELAQRVYFRLASLSGERLSWSPPLAATRQKVKIATTGSSQRHEATEERSENLESTDEFLSGAGSVLLDSGSSTIGEDFGVKRRAQSPDGEEQRRGSSRGLSSETSDEGILSESAEEAASRETEQQASRVEIPSGKNLFYLATGLMLLGTAVAYLYLVSGKRRGRRGRTSSIHSSSGQGNPGSKAQSHASVSGELSSPAPAVAAKLDRALAILGFQKSLAEIDLEELRERYKHLAKIFHSDKISAQTPAEIREVAEEKFREIKDAYELVYKEITGRTVQSDPSISES